MAEIFAVRPTPSGQFVHVYKRGYRPGRKPRSTPDTSTLCGVSAFRADLVRLTEEFVWSTLQPTAPSARPVWMWCRPCLGHLVDLCGLQRDVLALVVRDLAEVDTAVSGDRTRDAGGLE